MTMAYKIDNGFFFSQRNRKLSSILQGDINEEYKYGFKHARISMHSSFSRRLEKLSSAALFGVAESSATT